MALILSLSWLPNASAQCVPVLNGSDCGTVNTYGSTGSYCGPFTLPDCPPGMYCSYNGSNYRCLCAGSSCTLIPGNCIYSRGVDNCGNSCTEQGTVCTNNEYCSYNGNNYVCLCPVGTDCNTTPPNSAQSLISFTNKSLTADPVDIFSGEAYFSSTDFSFEGRGPKLTLSRRFRSFSTFSGMFGYGWRTDFDLNLSQDGHGNVSIYDGDGVAIYFMNNSGTYVASPGNYSTITKNADNTYTVTDKNGLITHYDLTGRLTSRTDRNGNALTFVYSPTQSGGTYIQDASGRKITLNFDLNGHIISAVDPAGKIFQYGYDTNGNLTSVTDPTGAVTNYIYDSILIHQIKQFTNANGHNTYYQYDEQGRCEMNWRDGNVNKTTLNYEANNTTVVTDSLGNSNTYVFNSTGLLLSHTDPLGKVTQQTWDSNMNRTSITDARNNTTTFLFNPQGNLLVITDPLNNKTTMTYTTDFNLLNSKIDALNNFTFYYFDTKGNLITITDSLMNVHSFVYDQYGEVITATDSRGNATHFTYDAFGHVIQKTDVLGNSTNFTYE